MEPSPNLPAGDGPEPSPSPAGELVVQNGRQSGVRRSLSLPITVIGRAPGCDIRLNAKGMHLLHCVLVQGRGGLVLRSLPSQSRTLVNGEPAATCLLREGDLLTVGPFHFRVRLPPPPEPGDIQEVWREKEALRIQAAAVAAQQAALMEEENRLQQRRGALEKQEEQLAAHLEERRGHLSGLREQVRNARAALRKERGDHADHCAREQRDLDRARREVLETRRRTELRRQRLTKLQRGLRQRWQRHWTAHDADLQRREGEVARLRRELEDQAERLKQGRAELAQEWLRFNGEIELGRRQLQDARGQLAAHQGRWEQEHARQEAELSERTQTLEQRAADLAHAERELNRRRRQWRESRLDLEREMEGLENRVRNQRRKLRDRQVELARRTAEAFPSPGRPEPAAVAATDTPAPEAEVSPSPGTTLPALPAARGEVDAAGQDLDPWSDWPRRLAVLDVLAAELTDQRLHLAEQFGRLLNAQQRWQQEREAAAGELEAVSRRLLEREQELDDREQALEPLENALRLRREQAAQMRFHLEAWRARLAERETVWQGEREALLGDLAVREKLLEQQQEALADLRQRWIEHKQQELEQLRIEQARHREAFEQYTSLWADCFRRSSVLHQEQRALAEKALALEQYRMESTGHAQNSAMAEKRLERLRRRCAALSAAAERGLTRDRQTVEAHLAHLGERFEQQQQQTADLARREAELNDRCTEHEQDEAAAEQARAQIEQALQSLRAERDVYQWQRDRLREEVERMALTILEEAGDTEPPAMRAA